MGRKAAWCATVQPEKLRRRRQMTTTAQAIATSSASYVTKRGHLNESVSFGHASKEAAGATRQENNWRLKKNTASATIQITKKGPRNWEPFLTKAWLLKWLDLLFRFPTMQPVPKRKRDRQRYAYSQSEQSHNYQCPLQPIHGASPEMLLSESHLD